MSYEDIIQLPHHVSKTRPQMSLHDRAAQFSPFAALTGHSDAINETARLAQEQADLDADQIEDLNRKLHALSSRSSAAPAIKITYFLEDENKEGGSYQTIETTLKKIDELNQQLILTDGTVIPMKYIRAIDE